MTHGGKRDGAGRPRKADLRMVVNFTLSPRVIKLLREHVGVGERSAFVEGAIVDAIGLKGLGISVKT